jgi:hypothetical protein
MNADPSRRNFLTMLSMFGAATLRPRRFEMMALSGVGQSVKRF